MTVSATFAATAAGSPVTSGRNNAQMGQADFLRLLTVQVQQQDPFDPVDNKEMLAQMAQFSSLSGITEMSATLKQISEKLDVLAAANAAATPTE